MSKFYLFDETRQGIIFFALGGIPVIVFSQLFHLLIGEVEISSLKCVLENGISIRYNPNYLINYVSWGGAHTLLCTLFVIYLIKLIRKNISDQKYRQIWKYSLIIMMFSLICIFLADGLDNRLATFSHERVYYILDSIIYYKNFFHLIPFKQDSTYSFLNFHAFSIFPVSLIVFGLSPFILACFAMGKLVVKFDKSSFHLDQSAKFRIEADKTLAKVRDIVQILSVTLVTTSAATLSLFLLPTSIIVNPLTMSQYQSTSIMLGIFWGMIFTQTLLFCSVPAFYLINKKIKSVIEERNFAMDPNTQDWVSKNIDLISIASNTRFSFSVILPLITTVLTAILSKVL